MKGPVANRVLEYSMNANKYTAKWICQYNDFLALESEWNQLAAQFSKHFFYRHEWFDSVWQWRQLDFDICILAIYQQNLLKGLLPLMVQTQKFKGLRYQQCELLTVPDTQFCDFITVEKHPDFFTFAMSALKNFSQWQKIKFHYLPENPVIQSIFSNYEHELINTTQHPVVTIEASFESFYAGKSRRLKKGNNLARNHLNKQGEMVVQNLKNLSPKESLNLIKQISEKSWKQSTQTTLDNHGPYSFFERLNQHLFNNDALSIWALVLNDEIIAFEYQIDYQNNIYALRSDYLLSYAEFSPGTYLNWQVLQQVFNDHKSGYYMGPGENKYKLRWHNTLQPVFTLFAYQNNITGTLLNTLEKKIIPKVKPLKRHLDQMFVKEKVE